MNEEEKKAIELLDLFEPDDLVECAMYRNALSIIKNLINKQNKVIDEMSKDIYNSQIECNRYFKDKEEVKQYFIRKVEEDGKDG
jgi:hypothetical protein